MLLANVHPNLLLFLERIEAKIGIPHLSGQVPQGIFFFCDRVLDFILSRMRGLNLTVVIKRLKCFREIDRISLLLLY